MAPVKARDPSIERSSEYEEFIEKLSEYHEKRGTTFDPEPKLNNRHVDLLRLYKRVIAEGGYDRASDTKGNALAWRRIASEIFPPGPHITTLAFQIKTVYYKNLAAYEIKNHHGKEPPPKEILEFLTAKGGDLLSRTVENYPPAGSREAVTLMNGADHSSVEGDIKPPGEDKMDVDELNNTPGRSLRVLREKPPQTALFQPDTSATRQPRSGQLHFTPNNHITNGVTPVSLTTYEPKPPLPATVKQVSAPSNNPEYFQNRRRKWIADRNARRSIHPIRGMMLPGTGFTGPNIYIRAMLALQCGKPDEIAYALHHLVKISHERGDKYRLDAFPGLAEALMMHILKASSLFYEVEWEVRYSDDDSLDQDNTLLGTTSTPDLLDKISMHPPKDIDDDVESSQFAQALSSVNEAALVLRNMVMLEENASYLANLPLIRDVITIVLMLPEKAVVAELRHNVLEIAEQLTKSFRLSLDDPVYHAILLQLDTDDRGIIITALRALSRIAIDFEDWRNSLEGVPVATLWKIYSWVLADDDELCNACLDFLYQFTAITENVEILLHHVELGSFVEHLVRFLMLNASTRTEDRAPTSNRTLQLGAETCPKLSLAIVSQLAAINDAKDQSSQWLRTCYEEDPDGEVTQIALWQAYTYTFEPVLPKSSLQQAKDFITNVSNTFPGANAQVVGNPPKYTIRGLRPRDEPVDLKGRPYVKCRWLVERQSIDSIKREVQCSESFLNARSVWEHIMIAHLGILQDSEGEFETEIRRDQKYDCKWAGCKHFRHMNASPSAYLVSRHVQTHLPDTSTKSSIRQRHNITPHNAEHAQEEVVRRWIVTQEDEQHNATGVVLGSILVLRNLARQLAKLDRKSELRNAQEMRASMGGGGGQMIHESFVSRIFRPVNEKLCFIGAHNWALRDYIGQLTKLINTGGGWLP